MNECPSIAELRGLINEDLAADDDARISAHVETCARCEHELARLTQHPSDTSLSRDSSSQDDGAAVPRDALARISGRLAEQFLSASETRGTTGKPLHLPVGFELDGYELLECIGSGGMGTVYRARHARLDREVAIKVLDGEQLAGSQRIARFRRESKAIGRLKHPNLVHAQDAGENDRYHYLVMEYLPGCNLDQLIRSLGPLRVADACEIIRQAAIGLQHCHAAGLVHRDIKPSNLMLTREQGEPIVKVLDLGLALITGGNTDTQTDLTRADSVVGTIDYMAPEQFGGKCVDIRADIYSLGATLFTLVAGRSPVASTSSNLLERLAHRAQEPPLSLAKLPTNVPRGLIDLVSRMLAVDPQDRPSTPGEVAESLEPFCQGHALDRLVGSSLVLSDSRAEKRLAGIEPRQVAVKDAGRKAKRSRVAAKRRLSRGAALLIGAAALLTLVLLAISFMNLGTIVVSANQDLLVEIVRDHATAERVEVGRAPRRIWSPAGEYEIWIPDQPHERILVTSQRFSLGRGATKEVAISLEASPELDVDPAESPALDPGRSYDLTRTGVVLLLRNELSVPIDCFFVGFDGIEYHCQHIEPGQTVSTGAAHGHLFRFRQNDKTLAYYVTRKILDQTCVISGQEGDIRVSSTETPAIDPDTDTYFYLQSKRFPEMALSVRGGASVNVGLDRQFSTSNQLFRFVPSGDGWYFIESKLQSRMVLTIVHAGTARQANLFVLPQIGEGTSAQRFRVLGAEEGFVRIVSALGKLFHLTLATDERDVVPGIYVGDATKFSLVRP